MWKRTRCDIMALEFKSGGFGCGRGEVVDPVKVVMLVNVSSVMSCEMLQVWWKTLDVIEVEIGCPVKVEMVRVKSCFSGNFQKWLRGRITILPLQINSFCNLLIIKKTTVRLFHLRYINSSAFYSHRPDLFNGFLICVIIWLKKEKEYLFANEVQINWSEAHSSFPLPGVSGGMVSGSNRVQSSEAPLWETGLLRILLLSLRGGFEPGFVGCYGILPYRMSLPTTPNRRSKKNVFYQLNLVFHYGCHVSDRTPSCLLLIIAGKMAVLVGSWP
ncbi:hypothetical protein LXL04_032782 [Taraxacum kok-saghyz]